MGRAVSLGGGAGGMLALLSSSSGGNAWGPIYKGICGVCDTQAEVRGQVWTRFSPPIVCGFWVPNLGR